MSDPPPLDPPPCHPRERATVSDRTVTPGQQIIVSTPPVFADSSPVVIQIVRANRNSSPVPLGGTSSADLTGAVSGQVTIPDVSRGVYFIYVVGQDADGNEVVAIAPIVVRPAGGSASAAEFHSASVRGDSATVVPAAVASVQQDLSPDVEAAVVDAVANDQSGLLLSPAGVLEVRTPSGTKPASALAKTGNDIATQVSAGSALLLAGTGLVLMRRRRSARA